MIPATAVIVAVAPAIVIAIAAVTTDAARIAATRVVVAAIIVRAIIESAVPHASAVDRQQAGAVSLDAAPYILRVDCGREGAQHFYRKLGYKDRGSLFLDNTSFEQPQEMIMLKDAAWR